MNDSEVMNDDSECLLIACETSDPFATLVINPKTAVSCWSFKGNELQGAVTGCVERLGEESNLMVLATKDSPLLHIFSLNTRKRFHIKSVLPEPAKHLAATPDGAVLFAAINNQIYCWIVATGDLISVIEAHYQSITGLVLSSDGSLLISAAEDGSLCVFIVAEPLRKWIEYISETGKICDDLHKSIRKICVRRAIMLSNIGTAALNIRVILVISLMSVDCAAENTPTLRKWQPHSLAVSDVCVTRHSNARILSCSKDHTAAFYSVTANECLLKISCDVALTSCAIDPAECRIFLGTAGGSVVQVDLYASNKTELSIVIEAQSSESLPLFNGHSTEVVRLEVNHDGSLLVSGDASGNYVIWDISSRQCLKTSSLKGSICKLKFLPWWWKDQQENEKEKELIHVSSLKRQKVKTLPERVPLLGISNNKEMSYSEELCAASLDKIISMYASEKTQCKSRTNEEQSVRTGEKNDDSTEERQDSDLETVNSLKAKIAALEIANQQIYDFAASLIIGKN